jgi:uncharacterized protein
MKFHLQTPSTNLVTGSGPGWIRVGAVEHREHVILAAGGVRTGWAPAGFDGLSADDFATLLAEKPEVILLGTGATQRFPHPRLLAAITAAGVGVEVMDTPAACRTYNILVGEGRNVTAALIVDR